LQKNTCIGGRADRSRRPASGKRGGVVGEGARTRETSWPTGEIEAIRSGDPQKECVDDSALVQRRNRRGGGGKGAQPTVRARSWDWARSNSSCRTFDPEKPGGARLGKNKQAVPES